MSLAGLNHVAKLLAMNSSRWINEAGGKPNVTGSDLVNIVQTHAVGAAATAAGSALLPGAGAAIAIAASIGCLWSMYYRINGALGLKTSKVVLKSLAAAIGSNLAQNVIGLIAGVAVASFIPGLNLGSCVAMGGACYALTIVGAIIYMKILLALVESGKSLNDLSEDELKDIARETVAETDVKHAFKEARKSYSA